MAAIKDWWFSSEACSESAMKDLTSWLEFWHFRYKRWGSHISKELLTSVVYIIFDIPDCKIVLGLSLEGCVC